MQLNAKFYSKLHVATQLYSKLHVAISYILIAMTDDRKQINVRIPAELCKKIENEGRQKQEVVSDALELYFSSNSNIDVAKDLEHEKEKNRILEANVRALEQQLGFLQQEYSKLSRVNEQLLLKPAPEEIQKKAWWQFWK